MNRLRTSTASNPFFSRSTLKVCVLALGLLTTAASAQTSDALANSPGVRWQARVQISTLGATGPLGLQSRNTPTLSASLLGDYYLTGSGLGPHVRGGLRATGGLMLGPLSIAQSGSGLTVGEQAYSLGQGLAIGQRNMPAFGDHGDGGAPLSYLGIGYSGSSVRHGWGFSADLGLVSRSSLRLGNSIGPVDEALRENRLMPVMQLGVSWRY